MGESDLLLRRPAGGEPGIVRLVDDFYRIMDEEPFAAAIRRMHPADLTISRDKLAVFLCGWLGGPRRYAERYGSIRIPAAHAHLRIGRDDRNAWLACMREAIALQPYTPAFATYLLEQLAIPADRVLATSRDPLTQE
jgi:hemoglobin